MNKKILVIFLFALVITNIIYRYFYKENTKVLLITDANLKLVSNNLEYYKFDNISFNELNKKITLNDNYLIKNKRIFLNQEINKANILLIDINGEEIKNKCKKDLAITKQFFDKEYNSYIELKQKLGKISKAKVVLLYYECKNNEETNNYLNKLYNKERCINLSKTPINSVIKDNFN